MQLRLTATPLIQALRYYDLNKSLSFSYLKNPLKGHSQLWNRTDLDTSFLTLERGLPQPEIKANREFRFNLRSVLLDFHSFTDKPILECAFFHPVMLFLSYLVI